MSGSTGWLDDLLCWLRDCGPQLRRAAEDTADVVVRIERCWTDDRGREWVERAGLVRRQLDRDAAECTEFADRVARIRDASDVSDVSGVPAERPVPTVGPLLGSIAARRIDAHRGMRIATMADEDSRAPGS
jgi:hypothetical protein